ncbi:hypothetical protein RJT34_15953 [Clitoria ternatea]|uniref:Uncharacterized protein n=1 Tax=Clitoria ternatea TaxID=43366 RepID=A0AAN9J6K7_CLITE
MDWNSNDQSGGSENGSGIGTESGMEAQYRSVIPVDVAHSQNKLAGLKEVFTNPSKIVFAFDDALINHTLRIKVARVTTIEQALPLNNSYLKEAWGH